MKTTCWVLLGALSLSCSKNPSPASTSPQPESKAEEREVAPPLKLDGSRSTSIRNPNDGSLEGGIALPLTAPGLRFNPKKDPAHRYGTAEVVQALVRAAAVVHRELGGDVVVGDLSLRGGGPIPRHGSHQNGRDVDVLFYLLGADGERLEPVGAFLDTEGRGVDFNDLKDPADDVLLQIDLPRTWRFVQALIEDGGGHLQRVFVAEHLRGMLLAEARRSGAPPATLERFSELSCQPSYPHDDHFHFRFFCTAEDINAGCRDSEPVYPWRAKELAAAGVKPKPLLSKRPGAKADIVTHEEARKAAGPLHADVEHWLDKRKAWLEQPHPGRPYCE